MTAIQRPSKTFATFCLSAITLGMVNFAGCQSLTPPTLRSPEPQQQSQRTLESVLKSDTHEAILLPAPPASDTETATAYEEGFATESERIELHNQKWGGNPLR